MRRKLEQSHIIPQFVYRWAKENTKAGAGHLRAPTRAMLCGGCEDLFSARESEFARLVFQPVAAGLPLSAKYFGWLRQFAASVCWRILEERMADDGPDAVAGRWSGEVASCRAVWRDYLMGRRPDVGAYHLHLLPVGAPLDGDRRAASSAAPAKCAIPPDVIAGEVCCTELGAFVCARLGPLILFGLIADTDPQLWQGTRINAEGKLKPRAVAVPAAHRAWLLSRPPAPA